jgi:hypothetical protein
MIKKKENTIEVVVQIKHYNKYLKKKLSKDFFVLESIAYFFLGLLVRFNDLLDIKIFKKED